MATCRLTITLAGLPVLALAACSGGALDPDEDASLEQELRLTPQLLSATAIPAVQSRNTLPSTSSTTAPRPLAITNG